MSFTNDIGKVATALGLFASAIKSGESWTPACERAQKEAHEALTRIGGNPDEVAARTVQACKLAVVGARFGPPSIWGGDRPKGWHLDRPCTPEEAAMHDNGCNDAFKAVARLHPQAKPD